MQKLSYLIGFIFSVMIGFAQSPHGDAFKTDCASCHNAVTWKVTKTNMTFDHNTTKFKLTGQHQSVDCKSCHQTLKFQEAKTECVACHADMHTNTLGPDCARCHTPKTWIIENAKTMHQLSRFPLEGNHAVVDCASCHKSSTNLKFEPLGVECIDCHRKDYLGTTFPNHQKLGYSTNCTDCHGVKSTAWTTTNFDHRVFPLTGGHNISCLQCHTSGNYQTLSTECKSCHQTNYNATQIPNHIKAGISTDCKTCHTITDYKTSTFNHSTTNFPLTGAHAAVVQCSSCHLGNTTSAKPECMSCHQTQYNGAKGHVASKFPTDCRVCHNNNNWLGATFNHSSTNFPLTGAHLTVDCASCHTTSYVGTSMECKSCHQAKYNTAQTPNHSAAGISVDCKTCHTTNAWQPSSFKHSTSGFDLTGAHAAVVQCSTCHAGNTTSTKPECISCHQTQYNGAKDHLASKFPTDCKLCHNNNNWLGATFNHSATNFPLTGAHTTVDCASCHTSGYVGTSLECKSCHQAKYNTAQSPNHTTAGISVDCKTCHTTTAWQPSSFKHSSTGFTLAGAHSTIVQCSSCHVGNTTLASPNCISCHQAQYNGAAGHVASKFPTDCTLCHNNNNWLNATFNHSATNFPLTGAHTTVDCASCHTSGYVGTSMECKSCHQAKYNTAQSPNHAAAGISVDCKTCHTTTAWQPSSFKHTSTGFTLAGAHASIVQCSSCHVGNTSSASPNCISCHQAQYNGAAGHVASKFPTDCTLCHNNNNWLGATFNHSLTNFPLTGAHTAVACASCHTTGYAGTSMECKSCHQTNYNTAANPNHKTLGLSVTCTDCHTTNPGWQPATFSIHSTYYALTGAHATIANNCAACHNGNYTTTPNACYACHTTDYNNTKNPVHKTSGFSTDCASCHKTTAWVPSTFNHTNYFPISSGKHTNISCATCHTTPTNYTIFTCVTAACHANAHNRSQGSTGCYKCHPTGKGD